jgi:hypothetical protein
VNQNPEAAPFSTPSPIWAARAFEPGSGGRPARARQSAAAAALLAELQGAAGSVGASSKAHTRHWVAAATIANGRVGIDLEYVTPQRPIIEIAAWLMGARPSDRAAAWRAFTFYEAYFKAFGETPAPALMRSVAQGETLLPGGARVLHAAPAADFVLTLVWG